MPDRENALTATGPITLNAKSLPKMHFPTSMLQNHYTGRFFFLNQYQVDQLWFFKIENFTLAYYLIKYEALPCSG